MVKKIQTYTNFNILNKHKNSILLIGNFDGLHIGHQKLFEFANRYKKKKRLKIGVITFDPIPKMFFNKNIKNYRISNFDEKVKLCKSFNVDFIINKQFDFKFSKIKYFQFIKNILFKKIKPKYIFVSNNFRFGNNREGDVKSLLKNSKDFKFTIIKPKPLKVNSKIISSTYLRRLLKKGKINLVNKYLKRNWSISGKVQQGRRVGRKIGFPTCNINLKDYIIPKLGVYAVRVFFKNNNNRFFKGIANVGFRPTFKQKKIILEVNIFNFSKNIYNKEIKVEFIKFLRGEKRFKNIDQLKKQIDKDILNCKKI